MYKVLYKFISLLYFSTMLSMLFTHIFPVLLTLWKWVLLSIKNFIFCRRRVWALCFIIMAAV